MATSTTIISGLDPSFRGEVFDLLAAIAGAGSTTRRNDDTTPQQIARDLETHPSARHVLVDTPDPFAIAHAVMAPASGRELTSIAAVVDARQLAVRIATGLPVAPTRRERLLLRIADHVIVVGDDAITEAAARRVERALADAQPLAVRMSVADVPQLLEASVRPNASFELRLESTHPFVLGADDEAFVAIDSEREWRAAEVHRIVTAVRNGRFGAPVRCEMLLRGAAGGYRVRCIGDRVRLTREPDARRRRNLIVLASIGCSADAVAAGLRHAVAG